MANFPGKGILFGIGALGQMAYESHKTQKTMDRVGNRDPRQAVIQNVLNEKYSYMDMKEAGSEFGLKRIEQINRAMLQKWCSHFGVPFNPYVNVHQPNHMGAGSTGADVSDTAIEAAIQAAFKAL